MKRLLLFAALVLAAGCTDAGPAGGGKADKVQTAMAQLSPGDRALAEQQRLCPVTDEPLGSMGRPVKLIVDGRPVFICCKGCEQELRSDAKKYMAKVLAR